MIQWNEIQKKAYKFIHKQGCVCLHCGSFQATDSLFCAVCEITLWKAHPKVTDFYEPGSGISGKALFSWVPDQDRMVSKLLLSLKGGRPQVAIDYYVGQFCSKISLERKLNNAILVPCPSLKKWDHALALATSFGSILDLPVRPCLRKESDQGPQKRLGRAQRLSSEMVVTEDIANQHVIFIDDIVTTGGTAAAAKRALGLKQGFEVWCLGRRQRGSHF